MNTSSIKTVMSGGAWAGAIVLATSVHAASLKRGFSEAAITSVISRGTALEFSPDGLLYVLEQGGTMEVYRGSGTQWKQVAPSRNFFTGYPLHVSAAGERGLLGIAFHPNFQNNRSLFVYYTAKTPTVHNRISRFKANAAGTQVVAGSERVLMDLEPLNNSHHNGGAMHFGPDGKLYVAVGDDFNPANAQTISNRKGKILRLNPNPNNPIPDDNPASIDGIPGTTSGENRAIWAAGLRNPYTFAFKPDADPPVMFINDVGQTTFEEINVGLAGANYGWNDTEGPFDQNFFSTYEHPILAYSHPGTGETNFPESANLTGFAITGGAFYIAPTQPYPANYAGDYFFADFVADWIKRFDPETGKVSNFATDVGNPVDLRIGKDGCLYYLARNHAGSNQGRVVRVRFDGR